MIVQSGDEVEMGRGSDWPGLKEDQGEVVERSVDVLLLVEQEKGQNTEENRNGKKSGKRKRNEIDDLFSGLV